MKSQITYTEKATKQQIKLNFIKEEFSLYIKWNNLKICLCTNNLQMFYICMQSHQQFSSTKIWEWLKVFLPPGYNMVGELMNMTQIKYFRSTEYTVWVPVRRNRRVKQSLCARYRFRSSTVKTGRAQCKFPRLYVAANTANEDKKLQKPILCIQLI